MMFFSKLQQKSWTEFLQNESIQRMKYFQKIGIKVGEEVKTDIKIDTKIKPGKESKEGCC